MPTGLEAGIFAYPRHLGGVPYVSPPALTGNCICNVAGGRVAHVGALMWAGGKPGDTINLHQARFTFGTVVKAGGSGLTVSAQLLNTTAPLNPDATKQAQFSIANGDSGFATGTSYLGTFGTDYSAVPFGTLIALVVEWDGSGRLGSDSFVVDGYANEVQATAGLPMQSCCLKYNGTSWSVVSNSSANVLFYSDTGVPCKLLGGFPAGTTAYSSGTFNNTSNPEERGMKFTAPYSGKVFGARVAINASNAAANFDVRLYNAAHTCLAKAVVDAHQLTSNSNQAYLDVLFTKDANGNALTDWADMTAGTAYYIMVVPTTATSANGLYGYTVNANGDLACVDGGVDCIGVTWHTNAYTETNTRRMFIQALLGAFTSGGPTGASVRVPVGVN